MYTKRLIIFSLLSSTPFVLGIPLSSDAPNPYGHPLIIGPNGTLVDAAAISPRNDIGPSTHMRRRGTNCDVPADAKCESYCEKLVNPQFSGTPFKNSNTITCNVEGSCAEAHSLAIAVTETFTISAEFGSSTEKDIATATLSLGASFSWSKTVTTTNTHSYTLTGGAQAGFLVFTPRMSQSCGDLRVYGSYQTDVDFFTYCTDEVLIEDPNSCGLSPNKLPDGTADGDWSFCHTTDGGAKKDGSIYKTGDGCMGLPPV